MINLLQINWLSMSTQSDLLKLRFLVQTNYMVTMQIYQKRKFTSSEYFVTVTRVKYYGFHLYACVQICANVAGIETYLFAVIFTSYNSTSYTITQ